MDDIENKMKSLESSVLSFTEELEQLEIAAKKLLNRVEEVQKSTKELLKNYLIE